MKGNIRGVVAGVFFSLFVVAFLTGTAFSETAVKDLEDIRLSIEKSALPGEKKAPLFRKVSDAVKSGIPSSDLDVIVKRGIARGFDARTLDESIDIVVVTREKGLPIRPVLDRLQQGLSKGVPPERLTAATRRLGEKLEAGDAIVSGLSKSGMKTDRESDRPAAVHTVARALERSIPEEAITKLGLKAVKQGASLSKVDAAVGSMTAFIEMGMPVEHASKLIGKAIDKGYAEKDLVMMEREMSGRLREGQKMDEVMKGMDRLMNSGAMGSEWHRGMQGGPMQGPGSSMGSGSTPHNMPGMGSHHGGGTGMGGHRH